MEQITIKLSKKQDKAFQILNDKETTELFYGGGAGGGKSFLGCVWVISSCLKYPNTRFLIGRAVLKTLKESTLLTFFSVCKEIFKLKGGEDYKYNSIEGKITFLKTNSEVYLKDLYLYPSDPEFDSLGSTEYTGAFIDEVSEITEKAKNIVMSRIRYLLDEYELVPKLLMASNPAKNFAYREYWRLWKDGKLPHYRKFVPALVGDNPYISDYYQENLLKLDKNSMERLLYGNWDYDDDPSRLFDFDDVVQMFSIKETSYYGKDLNMYLSADVARFGSDKSVIIIWKGTRIMKIYVREKQSTVVTKDDILGFSKMYNILNKNIVVDEDGVGGGIVDQLIGIQGFVNNSRPYEILTKQKLLRHNFANLKTQCYVKLSEYIKEGKITTEDLQIEIKDKIMEDLQQIKIKDLDKDGKLTIIPKEQIKESLGRSTDYSDAMMMRMLFEVKPKSRFILPVGAGRYR